MPPEPGRMGGRVTDRTGNGIPDAAVRAIPAGNGASGRNFLTRTDAGGRYVLEDVPPGEYRLHAEAPGFVGLWFEDALDEAGAQVVTVLSAAPALGFDFVLQAMGTPIEIDSSPTPPPGTLEADPPAVRARPSEVPSAERSAERSEEPSEGDKPSGFQTSNESGFVQFGGAVNGLALAGKYAYLIVGPRVLIYDVSDPLRPTPVGQTAVLPEVPDDLAVEPDGSWLYVATRASDFSAGRRAVSDFWAFDVHDATRPRLRGHCTFTAAAVGAVAIWQRYALLVTDAGLTVIELKDPYAPRDVGRVAMPLPGNRRSGWGTRWSGDVATVGDTALVARLWGLYLVDLTDPHDPRLVDVPQADPLWQRPSYSVAFRGVLAYVIQGTTDTERVLAILDLSRANLPVHVREIGVADLASSLDVEGDSLAVVGQQGQILQHLAVGESGTLAPGGPLTRLVPFPSEQSDVRVAGGLAFVALSRRGLVVARLQGNQERGQERGEPEETILPPITQLVRGDGFGFAAADVAGLYVLDITSGDLSVAATLALTVPISAAVAHSVLDTATVAPSVPITATVAPAVPVDSESSSAAVRSIAYLSGTVYAYTERDGLWVIDVRQPTHPQAVGPPVALPRLATVNQMAVDATNLYVAAGDGALHVYDVRDPRRPTLVSRMPGQGLLTLAVAGSYLYGTSAVFNMGQLHVYDVREPARPRQVQLMDLGSYYSRVTVFPPHFILTRGGDMVVLGLNADGTPQRLEQRNGFRVDQVTVLGSHLFAVNESRLEAVYRGSLLHAPPIAIGNTRLPMGSSDGDGVSDVVAIDGQVLVLRGQAGVFSYVPGPVVRGTTRYLARLEQSPMPEPIPPTASSSDCRDGPRRHVTLVFDASSVMAQPLSGSRQSLSGLEAAQMAGRAFVDAVDLAQIGVGVIRYDRQAEWLSGAAQHDRPALLEALRDLLGIRPRMAILPNQVDERIDLGLAAAAADAGDQLARSAIVVLAAGTPDAHVRGLAIDQAVALRGSGAVVHAIALGKNAVRGLAAALAGPDGQVLATGDQVELSAFYRALALGGGCRGR